MPARESGGDPGCAGIVHALALARQTPNLLGVRCQFPLLVTKKKVLLFFFSPYKGGLAF